MPQFNREGTGLGAGVDTDWYDPHRNSFTSSQTPDHYTVVSNTFPILHFPIN